MPRDIQSLFRTGGRELVDFLTFCVLSVNTDALFLYLVREFQLSPKAQSAVAIYDIFCHERAPARISDIRLLPPKDLRLANEVLPYHAVLKRIEESREIAERDPSDDSSPNEVKHPDASPDDPPAPDEIPAIPIPPRYLFDTVAKQLSTTSEKLKVLSETYDPQSSPHENLEGGELNAGQRAFVDNVWTPWARPYLVSAGFWRVSSIG